MKTATQVLCEIYGCKDVEDLHEDHLNMTHIKRILIAMEAYHASKQGTEDLEERYDLYTLKNLLRIAGYYSDDSCRTLLYSWIKQRILLIEKPSATIQELKSHMRSQEPRIPYTVVATNEWVSVRNNVPEHGKGVLIHLKGGFTTVGYRKKQDDGMYWQLFGDTELIVNENDEVTHWMELPETPKL